ncbi:hypothetical protein Tco_0291782 [Tanacetum coccineum]
MSSIWELTFFLGLQVMQRDDGIFISQDKYVADILKKFDFVTVKAASTPIETSRPDIMFVVCACARFQVTPKTSHLHAVKRIFRYLKGQSKLGLWYPRDSPFDLEDFSDSDYAGASLDRKSTTRAEYVAAANCYGQVLWIQNQMLNHGFNFMNTKIYIDNESIIYIVKNLVFHSKNKHIKIRHHFIRDSYEKKLIQVIKIHTDHNVADLLTKAFDVSSDEFGVKTGSCKVNAAMQDLVLLGEMAFLERSDENAEFHQIVDFFTTSSIHYALTVCPTIYAYYIKQFWATAKSKTVNDVKQIHATVDGKTMVISESSVRSDLHFNDEDGITCLSNDEIFVNLALMGYERVSTKLTFQKAFFSPQWKYLIHTILHCLSSKTTAWNEFSTNLASAVICLAKGQKFNFSKLIFDVEGEGSGQLFEPQPPSSTAPPSQVTTVATQHQKTHKPRRAKRGRDTEIPQSSGPPNKVGNEVEPIHAMMTENPNKEVKVQKTKPIFNEIDFDVLDDAMENVKGGSTAEQITIARDTLNTDSINVSTVGPLHVSTVGPSNVSTAGPSAGTAGDIFEDEMITIADTLVPIRSARSRTISVMIRNVEEEPRRATPVPIVQSQDKERKKFPLATQRAKTNQKQATNSEHNTGTKMETYLTHMAITHTLNEEQEILREEIQKLYEKEQKWINDFISLDYKMIKDSGKEDGDSQKQTKSSKKRPRAEHNEESVKKQKLEDEAEREELRACLDIVPGDDIAMDFESLSTKYPTID